MCVILPLFYPGPLVVVQYITTAIKEINIAVYHTNVLAIYFLDGGWRWRGSRQSNVSLCDCPASYLASEDLLTDLQENSANKILFPLDEH